MQFLNNLTNYKKNLLDRDYDNKKLFNLLDEKIEHLTKVYKKASKLKVMLKIKEIYNAKIWEVKIAD